MNPNSAATWQNLGLAHYHQQRFALAADAFEHAQRLAPRDCALSEYNYLLMKGEPLAQTLFGDIYSDKVVDASTCKLRR